MAFAGDADRGASGWDTRPREGLHIRPLNVEKGSERYSSRDDVFPPQTATWRNNLIALSQRRNLLFVAYSHQIYVWEPSGSFQRLGSDPEMIVTPVMKRPDSIGYISPHSPHAINNILVDDLGRDEVLLLVTDSGNVCGYRVEAIYSALERSANENQPRPFDGSQVDPFFVEYVEASAWGLAIHKFARLIAVTANTGLVTVFAFALVNPASDKNSDSCRSIDENDDFDDYGQTWLDIKKREQFLQLQDLMPNNHRTRNIKLTYTGHFTNIPAVAFFNSDLDPNGIWMVSTDIDNKLLVWKIWESLGPFNVYHFNDISFKPFPETLSYDERGWAVIALDPRTFHPLKSTHEACGGQPKHRLKDGRTVLDLTKLSNRVPNASQLYNYFPPAVKTKSELPVLPDIFGSDCCISGPEDASSVSTDDRNESQPKNNTHHRYDGQSQERDGLRGHMNAVSNLGGWARFPSPADTVSHRAVDGSVLEDRLSESSSDSNIDMETETESPQDVQDTHPDVPRPMQEPLTTAQFLQVALIEALGGDIPGAEEYFNNTIDDYSDIEEDEEADDLEMDDVEDNHTESGDMSETGAFAYHVFDRMLRNAFPGDPGSQEQTERLIPLSPVPALAHSNFPILHFSQTDIRLIPHPFAPHASVVCGAPLRQPITRPIVSIRACDRFNMVKYIPEHGLVVAASQKGRAAVIALTESEDAGLTFRVDWIVPFESQEKFGDRPLIPLLGMSVSPVQGFEMPPDIPYIPRGVENENDLTFHYHSSQEEANTPQTPCADNSQEGNIKHPHPSNERPDSAAESRQDSLLTLPECHARAAQIYKPDENWRGWNPSRRYRLLLMYADHTVMSYEFWYDWTTGPSGKTDDLGDEHLVF